MLSVNMLLINMHDSGVHSVDGHILLAHRTRKSYFGNINKLVRLNVQY